MITGLLWAIAIGVWLLLLIVASGIGRARRVGAQFSAAVQAWAAEQAQAVQNQPQKPIDSPE